MSDIENIEGCILLMAAVISPKTHRSPGGRKTVKEEEPTTLGEEWLALSSDILDIDLDIVKKKYEESQKYDATGQDNAG